MNGVRWVKLSVDLFDNRKIKYLRTTEDGDSKVLMWVMLLAIAGKCNASGLVFLTDSVPYTVESLASELGLYGHVVEEALTAFERLNMISWDRKTGMIAVLNWEEYQNTDRMDEIREYNRIKKRESRDKQRLMQSNNVNDNVNDKSMTSQRSQDTDIDIEEEYKNKNIRKKEDVKTSYENVLDGFCLSEEVKDAYREFLKMRKLQKKPMTDRALTMLINKVRDMAQDEKTQIEIINQSIVNGWQSVYPLKSPSETKNDNVRPINPALDFMHGSLKEQVKNLGKDFFADI